MGQQIKLNELDRAIAEFDYPVTRDQAASAGEDVTLLLADGEANLGETIRQSHDDEFETVADLSSEVLSLLPREAVGEPFQSEGEG